MLSSSTKTFKKTDYPKQRDYFNVTELTWNSANEVYSAFFRGRGREILPILELDDRPTFWCTTQKQHSEYGEVSYEFAAYFFANELIDTYLAWVWNFVFDRTEGNHKVKFKEADRVKKEFADLMKERFL